VARVIILEDLKNEILKKFKQKSKDIFRAMYGLKDNPHKGKTLGSVKGIVIKELKYENFRFYFITNGFVLKCLDEKELTQLLLKFVRMSDKNSQQKVINEIKNILQTVGSSGFS